jgi:DNA polymerase-3 subunit beta
MRLAIEKKELLQNIQHLASIVSTKNVSPILMNYLIEVDAETNLVKITASDLELTVIVRFQAAVSEGGRIAVSAKHFNEIVNFMPDAMIDLWKTDELLMIQCNKVDFNILCADPSLYPILPEPNFENAAMMSADLFHRMISKTTFAVSTDVNRAVLTGVCWKIMEHAHLMAATDGRKVAQIIIKSPELAKAEPSGDGDIFSDPANDKYVEKVIPVKTLTFIQRIYDSSEKEIRISVERNKMMFAYGKYTILANIIEHKYPEYQKAFVADLPNELMVKRDLLHTSIRRVALLAPEDNMRIRFEINSDQFEINTSDRDAGDAKEFIETYEYKGSPTNISFNYKYMLSIMEAMDTEKIRVKLGGPKEPMMIYNESDPENQEITFLLMPLRS